MTQTLPAGLVATALWLVLRLALPGLRRRGGAVLLTGVLVVGAPGLVMDMKKSAEVPNGGAYASVPLPKSQVDLARWVRDHSSPSDVLATNLHCRAVVDGWCDSRNFWLSAYAERRVLIEGWGFAPRVALTGPYTPFWDQELLRLNDEAIVAPTADLLAMLRDRHGVRWLVVDRQVAPESPELATLAERRHDTGRYAVYELR